VFIALLIGVAGLVALAGGTIALGVARRRFRRERLADATHTGALGRIAERYIPATRTPGSHGPRYTIDFTTADRTPVRFVTDSVGFGPKPVGAAVDVRYDPANPQDAFVAGGERTTAWILSVVGVVFTLVGLLVVLSALDLALR
jgi:hypothetical protein